MTLTHRHYKLLTPLFLRQGLKILQTRQLEVSSYFDIQFTIKPQIMTWWKRNDSPDLTCTHLKKNINTYYSFYHIVKKIKALKSIH